MFVSFKGGRPLPNPLRGRGGIRYSRLLISCKTNLAPSPPERAGERPVNLLLLSQFSFLLSFLHGLESTAVSLFHDGRRQRHNGLLHRFVRHPHGISFLFYREIRPLPIYNVTQSGFGGFGAFSGNASTSSSSGIYSGRFSSVLTMR